jgi:adenosylhomocysteine nucleosidase
MKEYKSSSIFPTYFLLDKNILVLETGIGKINSTMATQYVLDNFNFEYLYNIGLVGSISKRFDYGDVLRVGECRFYDVDVRGFESSLALGQIPNTDIISYKLNQEEIFSDLSEGKVISGDRFIDDQSLLGEIIEDYNPDCVEMEIASIAHVMYRHGQLDKLYSLKIVSDKADENAKEDFYAENRLFEKAREVVKKV